LTIKDNSVSISTEYIETVLFKIVTSSSDYRGVSQITLHFNITVVNDPVSFEYALPKLLTVKAQLEDGVMQGETKFIYTSLTNTGYLKVDGTLIIIVCIH